MIAGILLTSAGLLALTPYVLKRGWRDPSGDLLADGGYRSVLAAVDAFESASSITRPAVSIAAADVEELRAHLFGLRMTVSEVTADVQDARNALDDEAHDAAPSGEAEPAEEVA